MSESKRDPKPWDEMTWQEKKALSKQLREEMKDLKPHPEDDSAEILAAALGLTPAPVTSKARLVEPNLPPYSACGGLETEYVVSDGSSDEQSRLREECEAMSRELHDPTPEQKAEQDRYWRENPDLFKPAPK